MKQPADLLSSSQTASKALLLFVTLEKGMIRGLTKHVGTMLFTSIKVPLQITVALCDMAAWGGFAANTFAGLLLEIYIMLSLQFNLRVLNLF